MKVAKAMEIPLTPQNTNLTNLTILKSTTLRRDASSWKAITASWQNISRH